MIKINIKELGMDKHTVIRIKRLHKQGYPNPIERANFEKLSLDNLCKILFIANKVKDRRIKLKDSEIASNPVTLTIKSLPDAFKFADDLVKTSLEAESFHSGLVGEGVLVASYSKLDMSKLEVQILELNKEIKRKKEAIRVNYNAGAVGNLVDDSLPMDSQKPGLDN